MLENHAKEIAIAAGLLTALFVAQEAGYLLGRRAASRSAASGGGGGGANVGAAQGATLGLLGLLLGFSFAGAANRFLERQDLIVQEANAIGTTYLRADLLGEPHRSQVRQLLQEYVNHRVVESNRLAEGLRPEAAAQVAAFHTRLWRATRDGVAARPEMAKVMLDPVNEVIDLHSTRVAAGRKHIPPIIVGMLIGCSLLAMGAMGYGAGLGGGRWLLFNLSLTVVLAVALWTTIDLDNPRAGLLRLSDAPLRELTFDEAAR